MSNDQRRVDPVDLESIFGAPINTYSRAQAVEDGVLVDVTETAREAGFKVPTALTAAVWAKYVKVPEGVILQDEQGRLWDILWVGHLAIATLAKPEGVDSILYELYVRNDNLRPRPVQFRLHLGPGDHGEPVLTILMPGED